MAEQEIFRIEGDSSDAVQAIERLGDTLRELPATIDKISKSVTRLNTSVGTSFNKLDKTVSKFNGRLKTSEGAFKRTGKAVTGTSRKLNGMSARLATNQKRWVGVGKGLTSVNRRSTSLIGKLGKVSGAVTQVGSKAVPATKKLENGLKKVETQTKKVEVRAKKMGTSFATGAAKANAGIKRVGAGMQKMLGSMSRGITNTRNFFMVFADSVRLMSQSITNFGRSMMFFVSLPLAGALMKAVKVAVDFEDAMVRTGKTTDMWGESLRSLSQGIREMAKSTATSHVELATMAEQVGQLGVRGEGNILGLVDLFNKMSITTDLTADTVAKSMGKIGNAFGYDLSSQQGVKNLNALATTINRLENETAASAAEIVTSMLKWAQAANQLKITAAEAAGLSASLIAMGLSEEESGTALKNASFYMVKNIEKLQQAMSEQEKYNTVAKTRNEIETDAVGVFLDLADAASEAGSSTMAMTTLMEIGRLRGGRALMAMANNIDFVRENLQRANTEWRYGNSLLEEYERAMTSTKNQMGLLKNNANDVAITLGDALLPTINKIVQIAVPALQELNKWFQKLSDKTKLVMIGVTLLVIALGPLLFFFGQIMHAVTLVVWSFGTLFKLVPMLISAIAAFAGVVSSVGAAALLIPIAIVGAFAAILKVLSKNGVKVAEFFTKLADKALAWGEKLAQSFGGGFLAGAIKYIMTAVSTVARWIAGFFEAHSPPKKGPLRGIKKWGAALMETYLKGFELADFGILKDISGYIEKILTMGISDDGLMVKALGKLAKARVLFSKLIDTFNRTGQISKDLLNQVISGTGMYAKHLKNLIVLSLRYKRVQQELAQIEDRREKTQDRFNESILRISRGGGDARYKVSAIRASKRARDDDLRALKEREKYLQKEEEHLKEQMEMQKAMLDALLDQEDIFVRIEELLKRLAETMDEVGGEGGGYAFPEPDDMSEVRGAVEEATRAFDTLIERIETGRTMFEGFLQALRGEDPDSFEQFSGTDTMKEGGIAWTEKIKVAAPLYDTYIMLYELGEKILEVQGWFKNTSETIGGLWSTVSGWFGTAKKDVEDFAEDLNPANEALTNFSEVEGLEEQGKALGVMGDGWWFLAAGLAGFNASFDSSTIADFTGSIETLISVIGKDTQKNTVGEWLMNFGDAVSSLIGIVGGNALESLTSGLALLVEGFSQVLNFVKTGEADFDRYFELVDKWQELGSGKALDPTTAIFGALGDEEFDMTKFFPALEDIPSPVWFPKVEDIEIPEGATGMLDYLWEVSEEDKASAITTWNEMGVNMMEGLTSGLDENTSDATDTMTATMQDVVDAAAEVLQAKSPSQVFADLGKDTLLGFTEGFMKEMQPFIDATIRELLRWLTVLNRTIKPAIYQLGLDLGRGFITGIREILLAIAATAPEPFGSYIRELAMKLMIHSPSKVAEEIGGYFGEGFIQGVAGAMDGTDFAYAATQSFGDVGGVTSPTIILDIDDITISDEKDIDTLVDKVKDALAHDVYRGTKYAGHTSF